MAGGGSLRQADDAEAHGAVAGVAGADSHGVANAQFQAVSGATVQFDCHRGVLGVLAGVRQTLPHDPVGAAADRRGKRVAVLEVGVQRDVGAGGALPVEQGVQIAERGLWTAVGHVGSVRVPQQISIASPESTPSSS